MSDVDPASAAAPAPPRTTTAVPGAKRARHKRWTRVATIVTVAAVVAFGIGLALLVFGGGPKEEPRVAATRKFLAAIAEEVLVFAERQGRLPVDLKELFGPEGTSQYDAEPWDAWHHPFDYRVLDEEAWHFAVRSWGADEQADTADDLVWPDDTAWRATPE